ncbi:TPA: hypothetical protein LU109_003556 [Enterobacter hormaechei subsp. xiangfangensis]|nr:hypothetical protein [Enterobacter hormaechei subsp. xiangfangensis]
MDNKNLLWMAVAGLSGGFLGLTRQKKKLTVKDQVFFVISGLIVSFWLTPLLCSWYKLTDWEQVNGAAFCVGACWPKIMDKMGDLKQGIQVILKGTSK